MNEMRGIYTNVTDIRRRVFTEVARLSYQGGDTSAALVALPHKIIPGEISQYRNSVFLERAIIAERIRLAIGLPLQGAGDSAPINEGIQNSAIAQKYYDPPLVNIIPFACNACPEKRVLVTDVCRGCLAHPCHTVCPTGAVVLTPGGKTVIDQEKCIQCGKCIAVCPYSAILRTQRPCASACGVNAIGSDEHGRATINQELCVSCGMCLVNCPFGAIVDKGQLFQLIQSLQQGDSIYAIVAPSFVEQFPDLPPHKLKAAMRALGFADTIEVAVGADLCTLEEAKDFLRDVPHNQAFMATSCCPSWSAMARKFFPEFAQNISMALTPMVLTARLVKKKFGKKCKVVFIGPCCAKKLEASRQSVRSEVDFVLTFEELMGMFEAKAVIFDELCAAEQDALQGATADGKGFAASGGVAAAVVNAIHDIDPERTVNVASAQGLAECRKLLLMARSGRYNGFLLEGMACPGGCLGGAGTLASPTKALAALKKDKEQTPLQHCSQTPYKLDLPLLSD